MKHFKSQLYQIRGFVGPLFIIPIISLNIWAGTAPSSPEGAAFARYIASLQDRDGFFESGPIAVEIQASLPGLYKHAGVLAVRQLDESERSRYQVVGVDGDVAVAQEVIAPYLATLERLEKIPVSAVAITPKNYRFRYRGAMGTGPNLAYVYQITPKRKDEGLIEGQVWIDAATGAAIFQQGRFVKTPRSMAGKIEMVSDTALMNGHPAVRITHITLETPRLGRGELTITEAAVTALRQQHLIDQLREQ